MMNLQAGMASWSVDLWPQLLAHLWQSTLFALVLMPVLLLLRRAPARLRYSIWLVASLKFVVPSAALAPLASRFFAQSGGDLAAGSFGFGALLGGLQLLLRAPVTFASSLMAESQALLVAATAVWVTGAVTCATVWYLRRRQFALSLSSAVMTTSGEASDLLDRTRTRLAIRRPVALALTPDLVEPGVFRVWRPLLVLPERMTQHLSEAELEAIFLHELIHIRRWDNLVASLHMVLCCLFWFHPLVWLLDRRLLAVREEACDERVVELCGRPEPYVSGLLKTLRFGAGLRLAGVSSAGASNFRRRIERLLAGEGNGGSPTLRSPAFQRACLAVGLFLLVSFSVGAALEPVSVRDEACLSAADKAAGPDAPLVVVKRVKPFVADAATLERAGVAAARKGCEEARRKNPRIGSYSESPRRAAQ